MVDPAERDQLGERLREKTAELRARTAILLQCVGELAGSIAETEDEVARVHEDLAASRACPIAAPDLLRHAERARRFAEHERNEQQRWLSQSG